LGWRWAGCWRASASSGAGKSQTAIADLMMPACGSITQAVKLSYKAA